MYLIYFYISLLLSTKEAMQAPVEVLYSGLSPGFKGDHDL